jgi:hypothetical protein
MSRFYCEYCLALTLFLIGLVVPAIAQERLLPFQGRLADATGSPVPDGAYKVQFRIFDSPTGGAAVWDGEVHDATVNGGLINVLLGTKAPFSDTRIFNQTLYLEITVDVNGDNIINAGDPPMLPRQLIIPVIFSQDTARLQGSRWQEFFVTTTGEDPATNPAASRAKDAELLDGYDWSAVLDSGNDPTAPGATLRAELINPPAGGSLHGTGEIVEGYGGVFESVLDPRSLDTGWNPATNSGGDGIPDKPFDEGLTIKGDPYNPLTATYTLWMACVQNNIHTMNLPDPESQEVIDIVDPIRKAKVIADYNQVSVALRGKPVPNRTLTLETSNIYQWRLVEPANTAIPANNQTPDAMGYDSEWDCYWILGPINASTLYLVYRDTNDDSKYFFRTFNDNDLPVVPQELMELNIVKFSNNRKFIIYPDRLDQFDTAVVEIIGNSPTDPTLNAIRLTGLVLNQSRTWHGVFFDPINNEFHQFQGATSGGAVTTHEYAIISPNGIFQSLTSDNHSAISSVIQLQAGYDIQRRRGFTYSGIIPATGNANGSHIDVFDNNTKTWFDPSIETITGPNPGGRGGGIGFVNPLDGNFLVWGGADSNQATGPADSHLYAYNADAKIWTRYNFQTGWPTGKIFSGRCYDSVRQRMILFGGRSGWSGSSTESNELWELELGADRPLSGSMLKVD